MSDQELSWVAGALRGDEEAFSHLVETYQSRATPTIVIGDRVLIGFDPEEIDEALAG